MIATGHQNGFILETRAFEKKNPIELLNCRAMANNIYARADVRGDR